MSGMQASSFGFQKIINEHWSVRRAELFVQVHKEGTKNDVTVRAKMAVETKETKALAKKLHTDVKIQRTAKGGKITIAFKNDDELARLLNSL